MTPPIEWIEIKDSQQAKLVISKLDEKEKSLLLSALNEEKTWNAVKKTAGDVSALVEKFAESFYNSKPEGQDADELQASNKGLKEPFMKGYNDEFAEFKALPIGKIQDVFKQSYFSTPFFGTDQLINEPYGVWAALGRFLGILSQTDKSAIDLIFRINGACVEFTKVISKLKREKFDMNIIKQAFKNIDQSNLTSPKAVKNFNTLVATLKII